MAAGQGFKTFTTGEVLTAGDVNGYLMQGINVFTNATARDAAITAPAEGQFAFTKDNNSLWYYDGAAWVASGATGDIEGVTAGVGISGGGTSGTVTITNSMATAIDAKGDLVAGTGADAFARLAIGANGTVLTADSAEATGLKWVAAAGGGKVLQVVAAYTSTATTASSSTYIDTTLTCNITPSSTASKVLALVYQNGCVKSSASVSNGIGLRLYRGASLLTTFAYEGLQTDTSIVNKGNFSTAHLDSPATTSSTTYKTQMANTGSNAASVTTQQNAQSAIILIEIGA
jgi:hypothetical protein